MNTQTLINKIKEDAVLNNLASFFPDVKIYLVGGAVRDFLMGKSSYDRDLLVEGVEVCEFSKSVAEFFGGTFITLDEVNQIYRVVLPDKINYLDITTPVQNSLESDILRRDLTINAVAINIKTGEIYDPTNGISDIQNRIIKGIREENFTDDPLRLLRIFRFYSIYGFKIDCELLNIVKKYKSLIHQPAVERVIYELMKLFYGSYADLALLKMEECGILEEIFPFVKELKQVPPNLHHHLDLFNHSIETVKQLGLIYNNNCSSEVKEHMEKNDFGGYSRIAHLRLAAFMHDIGKFSCWTIEPDTKRHRFIKHEDVGAKMALSLLKSMKFSNKQITYISYIIKKHMYPTAVVSAPDLNEKVMMRYLRKSQDNAIDTILIAQADRLSALGPAITKEAVDENISSLNKLLEFCLAQKDLKPLPKLLNGNEVMKILNIKPSKKLGKILDALYEAQISGNVLTKQDAINFIKTVK